MCRFLHDFSLTASSSGAAPTPSPNARDTFPKTNRAHEPYVRPYVRGYVRLCAEHFVAKGPLGLDLGSRLPCSIGLLKPVCVPGARGCFSNYTLQ